MKQESHSCGLKTAARVLAASLAVATLCVRADFYILGGASNESNVGSESNPVLWSDTTKWTPATVPGGTDEINWAPTKTTSYRHAYVALDGDYVISMLTNNYRCLHLYKASSAVAPVTFTVNGQLNGNGYTYCHEIGDGVSLVLPVGATMILSKADHNYSGLDIKAGGSAEIWGDLQARVMKLEVNGSLVFAPSSYAIPSWGRTENDHDEINIYGGTASFPNGIAMSGTSSTPNNQVNQSGGSVTFGGNFTSALAWDYTWSGGTLCIEDDCAFGANVAMAIPASANVTVEVAADKTFSAANFTADATASITKNGAGIFSIAPTLAPIAVNAGGLGLAAASTYDLSGVTFASGAKIALTALGATVNAYDSSLIGNATFTADLSGATAGMAVLHSSSDALLEKAATDLASAVPTGFALQKVGTTLSIQAVSAYNFAVSGDILDPAGWGGSLPPAGADVAITGALTVATLSSGAFPAWNSIEVKDGATLRIATDATLPHVTLNNQATLAIANNATVTLANSADLFGVANSAQTVPSLSIESGAQLVVPGGAQFANVNISLGGTIATKTGEDGGIVFGYAAADETAFFGLTANGGTISLSASTSNSKYDTAPLRFCCPASGGTVVAIGSLMLTDATVLPVYGDHNYTFTRYPEYSLHLGVNNPTTELFEVVFDNTHWGVGGKTIIKGGGTFRLANGGSYVNYEAHSLWNRTAEISEMGRVVVGSGCLFSLNAMGNYGDKALDVKPGYRGFPAIVTEDGAIFESYRSTGNGNGVFAVSNGIWRTFEPYIVHEDVVRSRNVPFEGLCAVAVAENSTLTFTTRNQQNGHGYFNNGDDRVIELADVPITGGGSVALSNATANVFGVIVKSGANSATGTARVIAPATGMGATTLYFANGANWAGTVIADGNVMTTNLVDAAAACTNSFGTLELATNFPVRVWKSGGRIMANDALVVGSYAGSAKLSLELIGSGEEFGPGDKFVLGKIGADAKNTLPSLGANWKYIFGEAENGYCEVTLRYSQSFQIILR